MMNEEQGELKTASYKLALGFINRTIVISAQKHGMLT